MFEVLKYSFRSVISTITIIRLIKSFRYKGHELSTLTLTCGKTVVLIPSKFVFQVT